MSNKQEPVTLATVKQLTREVETLADLCEKQRQKIARLQREIKRLRAAAGNK